MVEDANVAWRELKDKDVNVLTDVSDMGAGRSFLVKYPDGHALHIHHIYKEVQAVRE